mgnify:CR=1 FL=1
MLFPSKEPTDLLRGRLMNKHATRLLVIGLTLGLTACASYRPRPLEPATTVAAFEQRSLRDPGLQVFLQRHDATPTTTTTPSSWDLRSLTWVALYYQPDLDVARAKWRVAEAAVITAGARPNPTLDFTNQYNVDAPAGVGPWTVGPTLNVPIETAGKRGDRIRQAQQLAEAARLNIAETAWQVRRRVRSSLLGVYPTVPLLRRQQERQAELVRLIERRTATGEASQPELTQARITLNQLSLNLQEAQKRLAENRVQLASALGLPVSALDGITLSLTAFEQVPPLSALPSHDVRRQALRDRPDVRAALADYEASQAALQGEVAKQYPDITLGPGFLWDAAQAKWSLGLSLVLPLLNHNQGPIAEARARRQQAAANFLAVQAQAIGEVDQALAGYRQVVRKLATADALLAAQRKASLSAEALYRAGETDRLSLIGAQVELAAAELARLDTLLQAQQSLGALEDAMRHPLGALATDIHTLENAPRMQDSQP